MMEYFTWEDVTIKQYEEIIAIASMKMNPTDRSIHYLTVFTGKDPEYYLDMAIPDLQKELKRISKLNPSDLKPRMLENGKYHINGAKYILTPSANRMKGSQLIDYEYTLKSNPNDIAMLCAIFCIPEGKTYGEGYDPLEVREIFYDKFKIVDALGISFFFLERLRISSNFILRYSKKVLKKEMKKERDLSRRQRIKEKIIEIGSTIPGKRL